MASKLALHVHQPSPAVDAAIRSAPWAAVKSLGNTQPLATARDAGVPIRILRMYGIERLDPAGAVAMWQGADLSAVTHVQLVCEDARGYDAAWQQAVKDGLRAGGYAGRFLVGGFATGNPQQIVDTPAGPHFPELEAIYSLLRRPDVDLALDEYSGILADDPRWPAWAPYTNQRHRLIVADLSRQGIAVKVLITESGGDSIQPEASGGGWQTRGWTAGDYLALLMALDAGDQTDDALIGRCIYTLNATADWAAFEIAPIISAMAEYVNKQKGSTHVTDYSKAAWAASPNFWTGRQGQAVKAIVLHGTAGPGAVSWFANPGSQVSAHYVVDVDGTITQCVAEADSAWHAGVVTSDSAYAGGPNPNLWTIGIEHVRDVTNTSAIAQAQLMASLALVEDIVARHGPLALILHNQIDVGRVCPGPGFPLQSFQDVVTPPAPAYGDSLEKEAANYYFQLGKSVDRSHALWTACLLPLWTFWSKLASSNDPLADLVKPGPLVSGEIGATWGGARPAGVAALTNRRVGVYQDAAGAWHPYQAEL